MTPRTRSASDAESPLRAATSTPGQDCFVSDSGGAVTRHVATVSAPEELEMVELMTWTERQPLAGARVEPTDGQQVRLKFGGHLWRLGGHLWRFGVSVVPVR